MANIDQIPFEIVLEKTKSEIFTSVNAIGQKYEMPSSILLMILEQIVYENKNGSYATLIRNMPIDLNQNGSTSPTPASKPTPAPTPEPIPKDPQVPKTNLKVTPKED